MPPAAAATLARENRVDTRKHRVMVDRVYDSMKAKVTDGSVRVRMSPY